MPGSQPGVGIDCLEHPFNKIRLNTLNNKPMWYHRTVERLDAPERRNPSDHGRALSFSEGQPDSIVPLSMGDNGAQRAWPARPFHPPELCDKIVDELPGPCDVNNGGVHVLD